MDHWLRGMFTPLVTPFSGNSLDEPAFLRLVDWQIQEGADGIVLGSASGEGSTLTDEERMRLLRLARAAAGPVYPIIAAAGSNATAQSIADVRNATAAGANAILLRLPYYNRPTQAGLVQHILSVAAATPLPLIIDNDPERCAVELAPETLAELAATPTIMGVLERRGDVARCDRIMRSCSRHFMRLTGAGDTIPAYLASGGCGAITSIGQSCAAAAGPDQGGLPHRLLRAGADPAAPPGSAPRPHRPGAGPRRHQTGIVAPASRHQPRLSAAPCHGGRVARRGPDLCAR